MRILCYGDSNTYGFDPRSWFSERYGPESRWPDLLAAKTRWEVINEGSCGREIPRSCRELCLLAENPPANRILLMLGTNDLLQGCSAAEAARRMDAFLDALTLQCPVLLIAPPAMVRGAWVPSDDLAVQSLLLAEEYRRLACRLGIPFINAAAWEIPMAFDGVHFTEAGHRRFAEELEKILREME